MPPDYYYYFVLNDQNEVVPAKTRDEALAMFENRKKRVLKKEKFGEAEVSTVFLVINHTFRPNIPPLVFETMIFGGEHDEYQTRCSTYAEALQMHEDAVALVKLNK